MDYIGDYIPVTDAEYAFKITSESDF